MDYHGKKIVVLGLGESGQQVARLLKSRGAIVTVRDQAPESETLNPRAEKLRALGIRVLLGADHPDDGNAAYDLVVLSPGISPKSTWLNKILKGSTAPRIGELEVGFQFCSRPIIAITGTNGKTTTTELVELILQSHGERAVACGNIGLALSAVVADGPDSPPTDKLVVEVSSFQLETITSFRPSVSVHLNLTPDHLDRHGTMEEYRNAKWQLFRNQTIDDFALVNANLELPPMTAQVITFSSEGLPADYELRDGWLCAKGERVLEQRRTHLLGPHNAENMLAALAVADIYKIPRAVTVNALSLYRPLPHRCEKVAEIQGVTYINDSKATNIDALEKALRSMNAPVVLIAGGKDKGLDFSSLTDLLRRRVRAVVLIGQMSDKLEATWGEWVPCHRAGTLLDAIDQASSQAASGDFVLLSPGCSSFDMFQSYEDRGDQFRKFVLDRAHRVSTNPTLRSNSLTP